MELQDFSYFDTGRRLALTFAVLIAVILGGNGLLLWQFHVARHQADSLTGVSQQVIAVWRLQESLLLFHQRLDELAQGKDTGRLESEAEPLRKTLLEQIERTRNELTHLPPGYVIYPGLLPMLEAIEVTLPSQLKAITELAQSGDGEGVHLRLANELTPLETETSALVKSIDREVSGEMADAVANMRRVQLRIFVIVPATAILSFFMAAFLGWAISRQMIDLRLEERVSERTRLARELHDTLLQTIEASRIIADVALEKPDRMRSTMERLSEWLGRAAEEGRAVLHSLRASSVQQDDLLEELRRGTEDLLQRQSLEITFERVGIPKEIDPLCRQEVFQIGCEAIRNACMHSEGSRVQVELRYAKDFVLRVSDNGRGIQPEILQLGKEGHFGLKGMQERAQRIGGKFELATAAGSGTVLTVRVPASAYAARAMQVSLPG